jgi:hypothetical protein
MDSKRWIKRGSSLAHQDAAAASSMAAWQIHGDVWRIFLAQQQPGPQRPPGVVIVIMMSTTPRGGGG